MRHIGEAKFSGINFSVCICWWLIVAKSIHFRVNSLSTMRLDTLPAGPSSLHTNGAYKVALACTRGEGLQPIRVEMTARGNRLSDFRGGLREKAQLAS